MKVKRETTKGVLQFIGKRLKNLRLKSGYSSARSFATINNIAPIQYWKVENGKANITIETLTAILGIHKITAQDFFCNSKYSLAPPIS